MSGKVFGTDGIRGVANVAPLTPQGVATLCYHVGRVLHECGIEGPVVMGRDTRGSGAWLAGAAAAGFCSAGRDVLDGGILPTPAVSLLTKKRQAALGLVLSASHNPAPDNGLKFFQADGAKVDPAFEASVEKRLALDPTSEQALLTGHHLGRLETWAEAEAEYVQALIEVFKDQLDLSGRRILVDAAHGAAYRTAPAVLRSLGAQVTLVGALPDGANINEGVGALHPEVVQERLASGSDFDLGMLFDGDADRGFLVDEGGGLLDGEDMLFLLATTADPRPEAVVGTVMSNMGLEVRLRQLGIAMRRADVGDKNVRAAMLEVEAPFGAEPSGHVIVDALGPTGDGLASCLAVLATVGGDPTRLAAGREGWERFPQVLVNVRVGRKPPLESIEGYAERLAEAQEGLGEAGRMLVRYSGTEPKVRVMAEAADQAAAEAAVEAVASFLREALADA